MQQRFLLIIGLFLGFLVPALAQENLGGIPYQAVARDASGAVLADQTLLVRVALTEKDQVRANYYVETHEVTTDELGFFSLEIGRGNTVIGTWEEIPWERPGLWLGIEVGSLGDADFVLQGRSELQTVPYAFNARTAHQLSEKEVEARNQSIYWTTSGNEKTRPPVHYLGTRDDQDLVMKTNMKTRAVITKDGQVQIYAGESIMGGDDKVESYALVLYAQNQGMWIKLDALRSGETNFMTFEDKNAIQGRIEGQTYDELLESFDFIAMNAMFGLSLTEELAKTAAELIQAVGLVAAAAAAAASLVLSFAAPGFSAAAAADFIKSVVFLAESIATIAETAEWNNEQIENLGVVYESGGADYAEWLPRMQDERDMLPGEIVGVHGGQISLNTTNASHLMVVSTKPIFLGNMSQSGNGEKVAFLGQVPVKVYGEVEVGDYILPSGNKDGMGVALSEDEMQAGDYKNIVGIAWQASGESEINMINTAIGMHQNALHGEVEELSGKVDNILNYLQGKGPLRPESQEAVATTAAPYRSQALSPEQQQRDLEIFDDYVDRQAIFLKSYYAKMGEQFRAANIDTEQYPLLHKLITNPVETIKEIRRDPRTVDQWGYLDQAIQSANN